MLRQTVGGPHASCPEDLTLGQDLVPLLGLLLTKPGGPTAQTWELYIYPKFRAPIRPTWAEQPFQVQGTPSQLPKRRVPHPNYPSAGYPHPNYPSLALSPLPEITRASRSRRFTGGGGVAGAARRGCGGT